MLAGQVGVGLALENKPVNLGVKFGQMPDELGAGHMII